MLVDISCLVVGGAGWCWVYFGLWWVVVHGGEWWHSSVWPIFNHAPCFNEMFRLFLENNLITPHQSGCKLGDSCINQLLLADLLKFINLLIMYLRLGLSS